MHPLPVCHQELSLGQSGLGIGREECSTDTRPALFEPCQYPFTPRRFQKGVVFEKPDKWRFRRPAPDCPGFRQCLAFSTLNDSQRTHIPFCVVGQPELRGILAYQHDFQAVSRRLTVQPRQSIPYLGKRVQGRNHCRQFFSRTHCASPARRTLTRDKNTVLPSPIKFNREETDNAGSSTASPEDRVSPGSRGSKWKVFAHTNPETVPESRPGFGFRGRN